MLTLIMETGNEKGILVLAKNKIPIAVKSLPSGPELSRTLALQVSQILNGEIPDAIAVGEGPGSYTGLRVGAALGKALAFGWDIPLYGFCSLSAFNPKPVLFDARGAGFYTLLEDTPLLLGPTDERLKDLTHFSSPTPELIKKRLGTHLVCLSDSPDVKWLAEQTYEKPFALNYLSHP